MIYHLINARCRLVSLALVVLLSGFGSAAGLPEIPPVSIQVATDGTAVLSWQAFRDQVYQVERSTSLGSGIWSTIQGPVVGDGQSKTCTDTTRSPKAFYRVAVITESFNPASLSPQWQLDAATDFGLLANGSVLARWSGTGLASSDQANPDWRPVFRDRSVVFDGNGDHLEFPMWSGGVGANWTLVLMLKVRPEIGPYRGICGGTFEANRSLELQWLGSNLTTRSTANTDPQIIATNYSLFPNNNWRTLVIRGGPGSVRARIDGYETWTGFTPVSTSQSGAFVLGSAYTKQGLSSPISVRYAAFFPRQLSDDELSKLERWIERKKGGEYAETQLFLTGGQSNYAYSNAQLRVALAASFPNPAVATSSHFSGTSLMAWMRDKAGGGYEVTPRIDLSGAPPGSLAAIQPMHGGDVTISEWLDQADRVRRNPKSLAAMLFIQGENDAAEAEYQWKPNGVSGGLIDYNLHYPSTYALAESYGARSVAWNNAVRAATGFPNLVCIYERVHFVNIVRNPAQIECEFRQRKSQILALANDRRYFVVDTAEIPREDGVHFNVEGAARFSRSVVRLLKRSGKLSSLTYHARMLAMRLIDSGMELTDAQMDACEVFVSTPSFDKLRSLTIPMLCAPDPVDQERLRRCNLLVHLSGVYDLGFLTSTPSNTVATAASGANQSLLVAAIQTLQSALGANMVTFTTE